MAFPFLGEAAFEGDRFCSFEREKENYSAMEKDFARSEDMKKRGEEEEDNEEEEEEEEEERIKEDEEAKKGKEREEWNGGNGLICNNIKD